MEATARSGETAMNLTPSERKQIADILNRRSNEIAGFADNYRKNPDHYGSVELAHTREINRLRKLADKVNPEPEETEEE